MKLLMVAPVPPPYGGIANWVVLMQNYIKTQSNVELLDIVDISPKKRDLDGRTLWDRLVVQGFHMFSINRIFKDRIKSLRPDVIHMTTSGQFAIIRDIFLLKTAKHLHIPTVYHIRFGRISEIRMANTLEWRFMKKAISIADKVISIDKFTYEALLNDYSSDKIVNIANPFDVAKIRMPSDDLKRKEVLFIGWCVKTKGIEELLGAWDDIYCKYPDWTLKLVGPINNDYFAELKKRFSFCNVDVMGECSHDLAMDILNSASVFILPSYTEGFPNSVLEAMAMKKAIIATNVGAIPEMLSGNSGIVIPSKSKEAIVCALFRLLEDESLREKMAVNAHNKVLKEYSIDNIFNKYESLWGQLINKR